MAKLLLENISKIYRNGFVALKDFNLEIMNKEFIVLVGPSGCGKSTLLRVIAGLENISSGNLYINGKIANDLEPKDRDIAMVFQNYALYPHKNVYDNLSFGLKIKKTNKDEIDRKVKEVSQILNLESLLNRKPYQLSGGQKQRVALGRAIIRKPSVFLMDEPLSNLDAKLRTLMRAEINKLQKKLETTMIYVTHDQTEAMTMGDRIVVMKDGIIQQIGTPDEVYKSPNNIFVAEFIGTPSINLIPVSKINYLNFDKNFIKLDIIVGIRAENLRIIKGEEYTISIIENLGSEKIVYLENETEKISIKTESDIPFKVGDIVGIEIKDKNSLHYFDKTTGNRIL